jgi:hypothetical protein
MAGLEPGGGDVGRPGAPTRRTTLRRCVPTIGVEEGKLPSEVLRERLPPDMVDQREQFDHPTKTVATPANPNAEANKGRDIAEATNWT